MVIRSSRSPLVSSPLDRFSNQLDALPIRMTFAMPPKCLECGSSRRASVRRQITLPEPVLRGRQNDSGDHVVEGLYDALVESCKHLLQMTAFHDQLAECGIVCCA